MARRLLASDYLVLALCVLYAMCVAPFAPGFASGANAQTVLAYLLPILVVAVGMTLALVIGGIDLSVTSIIALASVMGAKVMSAEGGWLAGHALAVPAAVAMMLAVGLGVGCINGFAVTVCKIPAFMATLTTMMLLSGAAIWFTRSQKISALPAGFTLLGQNLWAAVAIAGGATWLAHFVLSRTVYGKWLYAIGHNARAALIAGAPVNRLVFATYAATGLFAAVSSIIFTASLETGNPEMARDNLLDVIGAVVIGGASLHGGKGRALGTLFGVLFLGLIDNSLNLIGLSFYTITMVKGGLILSAALLDVLRVKYLG